MKCSDKINGYWEEGYHYYLEFRDNRLTVRDYRRAVALETTVSYDAALVESEKKAVISLEDNVLSRTASGEPFTMIKELSYEDGELKLLYYYTIMGEKLYTLKKVENGPFDHIVIRDKEFLPSLQGKWVAWSAYPKKYPETLEISGDKLTITGFREAPIHVVSYKNNMERVTIVPANLIDNAFDSYTEISVLPDMLTARMIIMDARVPLTVFARPDMLDKITIPDEAKEPIRSTMMCQPYKSL